MITRKVLTGVLEYVTGKTNELGSGNKYKRSLYKQINLSLKVYLGRREFNPNLDGKELYANAKSCLELAGYEVESYE